MEGASYFEMLATSVACFLSRGGCLMIGASMLRAFACSNLTHLGVLHLLFRQQFAATFIACLCARAALPGVRGCV